MWDYCQSKAKQSNTQEDCDKYVQQINANSVEQCFPSLGVLGDPQEVHVCAPSQLPVDSGREMGGEDKHGLSGGVPDDQVGNHGSSVLNSLLRGTAVWQFLPRLFTEGFSPVTKHIVFPTHAGIVCQHPDLPLHIFPGLLYHWLSLSLTFITSVTLSWVTRAGPWMEVPGLPPDLIRPLWEAAGAHPWLLRIMAPFCW